MVPRFSAPSRPSNITQTLSPARLTRSWSLVSYTCSLRSAFSYALAFSLPGLPVVVLVASASRFSDFLLTASAAQVEGVFTNIAH